MNGIEGKVAIVTGAGRGIGQTVALGLAEQGALIVANDLDQEPLNETLSQIEAMGGKGVGLAASVGDANIGTRLADLAVSSF
ncbi:MAG: SDR family NAD(P)-dependent oxidoreductase, partial [Chloroflexi bacterium]|nr:SDR family NAD(P)-dependent oxidoreductase [Chloroflexota bacterium]